MFVANERVQVRKKRINRVNEKRQTMYENVTPGRVVTFPTRFSPYLFQKALSCVHFMRGELCVSVILRPYAIFCFSVKYT